jgi:hypothetical protein
VASDIEAARAVEINRKERAYHRAELDKLMSKPPEGATTNQIQDAIAWREVEIAECTRNIETYGGYHG